ncbi:MAG TPA: alpha/beta fold hydrolase [Chloroflexota bacterium]|jgi:alpha-beta hydrolase superfamily lysophospholipase|nr:alpha/beta fold hydrolase [Chloroflexota bacterium]
MEGAPLLVPIAFVFAPFAGLAIVAVGVALAIAAVSAHRVVRPSRLWRPANWHAPEPPHETVTFRNEAGQTLSAWYVSPPSSGAPVVLVCHGFGTNRLEGQDVLPWLAAAGYGALVFDFQAHGESEGRLTTVGLREVDDILAAVRYVQEREGAAVPIFGLGFSMGASALIVAAARCHAIQALFLDSPFATLRRAIAHSFHFFFRLPPRLFTRPTIWFAERFTGARVGDVEPIRAVAAIAPRPIAIAQGTADSIVNPEDSLLLYAAAGEPKRLWRVEGVGHVGLRAVLPEEYRARALEFFSAARAALDGGTHPMDGELLVADDLGTRQLAAAHVE